MPLKAEIALLTQAAREGGALAMKYWQKDPQSWDKGQGQGPVSEADLAVDALLKDKLCKDRPSYGWLSEESPDDLARLTKPRVFIVDPIDGTRAYLAGEKGFAIALALADGATGQIIAAAVFLPALDKLYHATAGTEPAYLNDVPIHTSQHGGTLQDARLLLPRAQRTARYWPGGPPSEAHCDSRASLAHRLCLVAEGVYDGMAQLTRSWEWDIAAGALICAQAGVALSTSEGQALRFNTPERSSLKGIVAANSHLHDALIKRLR